MKLRRSHLFESSGIGFELPISFGRTICRNEGFQQSFQCGSIQRSLGELVSRCLLQRFEIAGRELCQESLLLKNDFAWF